MLKSAGQEEIVERKIKLLVKALLLIVWFILLGTFANYAFFLLALYGPVAISYDIYYGSVLFLDLSLFGLFIYLFFRWLNKVAR